MDQIILIKSKHPALKRYYDAIASYSCADVTHETAIRSAFQNLLSETAKKRGWILIPEQPMQVHGQRIIPDGTLQDEFKFPRGYWEAKDTHDNLDTEIKSKLERGYPAVNTIFEDTQTAVLYQDGREIRRFDLSKPDELVDLLNSFFTHTEPAIDEFEKAVVEFKSKVEDIANGLKDKIEEAHVKNREFKNVFGQFFELCQNTLNPNISVDAVNEMLIQHLLTERLFRTVFNDPDFVRKNVIAFEIEKVIASLTKKSFNRQEFLKSLDKFYVAIESAAHDIVDFTDKQHFLNTVYERFFQGYSVKVADTHGIVYTPQPIVDFMCASVEEVLKEEFGYSLGSSEVNILDPCTGTGNFIVNLMRRIPKQHLKKMYLNHMFANEVMLLPYYIASLNIEHAYYEIMGEYEPFDGLCFIDTLDLAKGRQTMLAFTEENTKRVEREIKSPITVIIGNPPYNAWQLNENDNNKNRIYDIVDARIKETYAKDSKATNKNALADMYVKFYRWAADRLNGREGIVCFVSNNGFLRGIAFDGFRKHLEKEFQSIYHFDFKGNARTSGERRRQEGGNIFDDQIRVGVGITILVHSKKKRKTRIYYHVVPDYWRAKEKKQYLRTLNVKSKVQWTQLKSDDRHSWLVPEHVDEFMSFIPLGTKETKRNHIEQAETVFHIYSNGVKTNRDEVVYDFDKYQLEMRVKEFIEDYNSEVDRYIRKTRNDNNDKIEKINIDDFVKYDKIMWSESLKKAVQRKQYLTFDNTKFRLSEYRPFCRMHLYFDELLIERRYKFPFIYPEEPVEKKNPVICVPGLGHNQQFQPFITNRIPCLGFVEAAQCFPFYTYDEDGSNRQENITDWALEQYRTKYKDQTITKWDIFYYVYGILHHPSYRDKYADNLKRDLPRIPFAPDFWSFAKAGKELAKWHLDYETIEPYKLNFDFSDKVPMSYRVDDKMRLSRDKTELKVNASLTLTGIPEEVYEYKLGNRSALEWVIEYYKVKEFPRSGIVSDPNNDDDEQYIVRLIGQVTRVSLETVRIVKGLPEAFE